MHRDADGSRLVRNGPGDGLADPPCGISGKFVALAVVKLLHCLDEPQISLLDQIKKKHASAHIPLCNAHHQPQIRLSQALFRILVPQLHPLGQLDFLIGRKQGHLADFL